MRRYQVHFVYCIYNKNVINLKYQKVKGIYMANEVVKYHNDLNTVAMRKWTAEEMNFFFAIITKAKSKGIERLQFDTDELKELIDYSQKNNKRWEDTMEGCVKKVSQLVYFEKTEEEFRAMPLFALFTVSLRKKTVEVSLSPYFEYILNKLEAQFTQYELEEFTQIRSTYAKTAYRLLKQWRTVGRRELKINEFRALLDIPKYYQISDIERLVIKPIQKELPQYFPDLKVKKVKSNKRGNPVIAYEFTWQAETTAEWNPDKFKTTKKVSSVPNWHEDNYVNKTTEDEKKHLEEEKQRLLNKVRK